MAPFYYLPDFAGLFIWNFLNCFVLFWGIKNLKFATKQNILFLMGFVLLELILSTQSSQSNCLIAGLIICSFNELELQRPGRASFLIVLGAFIKLFAVVAALLFLFYPNKLRSTLYMILWVIVLTLLPLIVISKSQLMTQYQNWLFLLGKDHSKSTGMSVYTIIWYLTGHVNKIYTLLAGVVFLLLPLIRTGRYKEFGFRIWYLSAILIWIVIFNHKGESPTYIIAMAGCGICAIFAEKRRFLKAVMLLCWILTSAIKTDLIPLVIKEHLNLNFINALMPAIIFLLIVVSITTRLNLFKYKTTIA